MRTWIATGLYSFSLLRDGLGAETIILARPYALFVLIGMARQLALWQAGDKRGLIGATIILGIVMASISRTALAAALLMVPLIGLVQGGKKGFGIAIGSTVLGFARDGRGRDVQRANLRALLRLRRLDASGRRRNQRQRTHRALAENLGKAPIQEPILGHGAGSASNYIGYYFPNPGIGHPHNDFLRFFHDFGIVGLSFWVVFHVSIAVVLFLRARTEIKKGTGDQKYHIVPLFGLITLAIAMSTDNPVTYLFVMAPLGIMLGCSLGVSAAKSNVVQPKAVPIAAKSRWLVFSGDRPIWRRRMSSATGSTSMPAVSPRPRFTRRRKV